MLERVLRGGGPIAPEYPLVFEERFPGRLLAVREGDEVCTACAILTREFLVDGTRVKGGLIGSVATGEEWRRHGLATRVLVEAEAALQVEGCAFALLWAEQPEFYLKRGYGPIGCEVDFLLTEELARALPEVAGARAMTEEDVPAVHALYERHSTRVERSLDESRALLGCPRMRRLVVERDGAVVAYACLGRGGDFEGTIHEWSGAKDDVLGLIRAHAELRFDQPARSDEHRMLYFLAPTSEAEVVDALEAAGAPTRRSMLGLGKILDRQATARVLNELLPPGASVEVVSDPARLPFLFHGAGKHGQLDDEGILALLFGVSEVREDVAAFLEDFGVPGAPLPIEPFAWGLDSI